LFAVGCTGVNYVGNSFYPTTAIDVYFSKQDIETGYTVMGHALGTGSWGASYDEIRQRLIKEAQNRGADAILITGLGESHIPVDGEDGGVSHIKQDHINASFLKHQ